MYDVFISFKNSDAGNPTRDAGLADDLYHHLKAAGLRVFQSNETLAAQGADNWRDRINEALDLADVLVIVCTKAEYLSSDWIHYEWKEFRNRMGPGLKPAGRIFLYSAGVHHSEVPDQLKPYQVIDVDSPDSRAGLLERVLNGLCFREPEQRKDEWMIQEAMDHPRFRGEIQALCDQLDADSKPAQAQVVITLYGRSSDEQGIGSFEYELLYYRRLLYTAPMFGPIVEDDDRITFAIGSRPMVTGVVEGSPKPGGFVERERIRSFAKIKLASGHRPSPPAAVPGSSSVSGLLFVNGRKREIPEAAFTSPRFRASAHLLTQSVAEIMSARSVNVARRTMKATSPANRLAPLASVDADGLCAFFARASKVIREVLKDTDLSINAYAFRNDSSRLHWLWSDGPTSCKATELVPGPPEERRLYVQSVAADSNKKSLLVHDLHADASRAARAVFTRIGKEARSTLVVPVLSVDTQSQLLGVLELQSRKQRQFDSDDVRSMYLLCRLGISDAFEKIVKTPVRKYPLHSTQPFQPFPKRPLSYEVRDVLELAFNPMKLLLHWPLVRELLVDGTTSRPATLEVWPNMVCNHACTWCRTEKDRKLYRMQNKEMTRTELLAIASDVARLGDVDVLISGGGEPMLHPDIHKFMAAMREHRGSVGVFSNGTRPADFAFWQNFLEQDSGHRFVRLSFNGQTPENYFRIHFDQPDREELPENYTSHYAEARKLLLDLLAMRSGNTTVAMGDTVQYHEVRDVKAKAAHARQIGVDFIQMRPELYESAHDHRRGDAVCGAVKQIKSEFDSKQFAVVHTDGERSFVNHSEKRCYAMHLVPTLVPDAEAGWTRIMPCSYAINIWGKVPDLGRMRDGGSVVEFWKRMNARLTRGEESSDAAYEVEIRSNIDPTQGCPQCRYYRMNLRLERIAAKVEHLGLIDRLVQALKSSTPLEPDLAADLAATWDRETIDIDLAARAFDLSRKLRFIPSF